MILLAYNPVTKVCVHREGMPEHEHIEKGYPWVYIDQEGVKYYPVYFNDKYKIAVVISKEEL